MVSPLKSMGWGPASLRLYLTLMAIDAEGNKDEKTAGNLGYSYIYIYISPRYPKTNPNRSRITKFYPRRQTHWNGSAKLPQRLSSLEPPSHFSQSFSLVCPNVVTGLITGWWFEQSWKIWNSMGRIIPYIMENKIHVWNHQPDYDSSI